MIMVTKKLILLIAYTSLIWTQVPLNPIQANESIMANSLGDILLVQSDRTQRIQFSPNTNSKVISDSVVRGTRDIYLMGAKAAQTMIITITSVENNAVFDVMSPSGQLLAQEKTTYRLVLPKTGDYKIIVGGTRGNASYKLKVEIK